MKSKKVKNILKFTFFVFVGILLLVHIKTQVFTTSAEQNQPGVQVVNVVDGDTVEININGRVQKARFIGMDTPETVDPRKPVQCFGQEASQRAKELLQGQLIEIETDPISGEYDKYDRMLIFGRLNDGRLFNHIMIAEGYAHEYTYQNQMYKYRDEFQQAENYAKENQLGLWNPQTCDGVTK